MARASVREITLAAGFAAAMFVLFGCQMDHGPTQDAFITDEMETSLVGPRAADFEEQQIVITSPNFIEDAPLDPTTSLSQFRCT